MRKYSSKAITGLMLSVLFMTILPIVLVTSASADYVAESYCVAFWHFDKADGNNLTSDAAGDNPATLYGTPPPLLVEGKFGKALEFDGRNFVYVAPVSSNLDVSSDITIDAWIKVKAFTSASYNNIVVKCARAGVHWQTTSRMLGLAVAGYSDDDGAVPAGSLRGSILTDTGGFNEIVTSEPVIPLNQWVHVALRRNLVTGMHLYVNGAEQNVRVVSGVQNPPGSIEKGAELYLGHDSEIVIDEVKISSAQLPLVSLQALDIGSNLFSAVVIVALVFAVAWILRRVIQTWGIISRTKS